MAGAEAALKPPVAERGPIGKADGGNRRDWFPRVRGLRAAPVPHIFSHIYFVRMRTLLTLVLDQNIIEEYLHHLLRRVMCHFADGDDQN